MSNLADRLTRMTVTVTSPDGKLSATADSERRVQFRMRVDAPQDYTTRELARQLCAVLSALDEGRRRGVREAYATAGKRLSAMDDSPGGEAEHRFRRKLAEVTAVGSSRRRLVKLKMATASDGYRARIHPEVPTRLTAKQITAEFDSAYRELRADYLRRRFTLLREHLPG